MHLDHHPSEPRAVVGPAGWGLGHSLVAILAIAMVVWGIWNWMAHAPKGSSMAVGEGGGQTAPAGEDAGSRAEAARPRARPFERSGDATVGTGTIPWQARLHTNGNLDVDRMRRDEAYARKVIQSDRLKTLIRSPARDTPEFNQIVAFADRKGLPLAATVDLYNILWSAREHETRLATVTTPAEKEAIGLVRGMELADFQRRFQQDYAVDVAPTLEELFVLPIHPTVFMGIPQRAFVGGEALLSD